MSQFTDTEVRDALVRAVEAKGSDYIYPHTNDPSGKVDSLGQPLKGCYYTVDGKPSCIVGHVLHYLGLTDRIKEDLTVFNLRLENVLSNTAIVGLDFAQSRQDSGKTWGEALEAFDKAVARQEQEVYA